ncbi:hypothetical protein H1D32_19750 [Anaerobacillus sp. CMMVII]|uniref:hypothetical protein n=1 Tax=Anaerobacillus sp. CMMVII TaxID=2755588 RepID=UPI0021B78A40|nr:hypothetical protein [Anaerobacillus sp. CMMVII]MCT8139742.1 hypothetical protein [Anaerobacillus sp. CMMVII]
MNPRLIFIDEPFYQLSNSKRKLILTTIKDKLHEWKGCPVVIFCSYIYEWLPYCDRLVIMKNKTILQEGEPKVLLKDPKHVFVAKYMNGEGFSF